MHLFNLRLSSVLPVVLLSAVSPILLPVSLAAQTGPSITPQKVDYDAARLVAHQSPEWPSIQRHLPDPATATAKDLEVQADILRARRYPEDALEFYTYALRRGGPTSAIYKKMGVTQLELRNIVLAQILFEKAVKLNPKDAEAWNNLGAVLYISHRYSFAVDNYKKSLKLDKQSAIYHSNLGMAYFDLKDYKKARKEIAAALRIDPAVFQKSNSNGVSAHVLSPEDRARFCLEMAKTYASEGNEAEMLHSLSMASEAGMNVIAEMGKDKVLAGFKNDPRVLLLLENVKSLRVNQAGLTPIASVPTIRPASSTAE